MSIMKNKFVDILIPLYYLLHQCYDINVKTNTNEVMGIRRVLPPLGWDCLKSVCVCVCVCVCVWGGGGGLGQFADLQGRKRKGGA